MLGDLRSTPREAGQQRGINRSDLVTTFSMLPPLQTEPVHQLGSKMGLIHGSSRWPVSVEASAIDGAPSTVISLCHVGDDNVGVKMRVERTTDAVGEACRDDPLGTVNFSALFGCAANP